MKPKHLQTVWVVAQLLCWYVIFLVGLICINWD